MSTVFFTDRDLGARVFPDRLRGAGLAVEAHTDHFAPDSPDAHWLPRVAGRGWVILTSDQAIMRRALERDSLMAAGARVFVLVGGNAPVMELGDNFINTLAKVEATLASVPAPFIAKIYRPTPKTRIAAGRPGSVEVKLTASNPIPS